MKGIVIGILCAWAIYAAGACAFDSATREHADANPLHCHNLSEAQCEALLESGY